MADEKPEEKVEEKKEGNGILSTLLSTVKLEWLRPLVYNLGGRKILVTGGALAVIQSIVSTEGEFGVFKGLACVAVAIVSACTVLATAIEDSAKKKEEKNA